MDFICGKHCSSVDTEDNTQLALCYDFNLFRAHGSDNPLSKNIVSYENEFDSLPKLTIIMPEDSVRGTPKECYYCKRQISDETVKIPRFLQ